MGACVITATKCRPGCVLKPDLQACSREYFVELSASINKSEANAPDFAPELRRFHLGFMETLADDDLNDVIRMGTITNAYAAISRHNNQTYSGTSPILETECSFSSHSLLGVGTVSLALARVRRFVADRIGEANYFARLEALKQEKCQPLFWKKLSPSADYWIQDHLQSVGFSDKSAGADDTSDGAEQDVEEGEDGSWVIPAISFLSGRDGFRSTEVSLSAPWELVAGCNMTSWTAHTLTHEISHTIIETVLAILLPPLDTEDS